MTREGLRRWGGWLAAGAIVGLFLFAASRGLDAPGLEWEEAYDPSLGMRIALSQPMGPTDWWVTVRGRDYPLKTEAPYDFSAFTVWYSALAFKLAGVSALTLRWAALAVAAALLLLFYAFSRRWVSEPAALAACLMAAAHPSFLPTSRAGFYYIELFVALPEMAALWLVSVWHQSRRPWALYAGCFFWAFGLNVSTKALAYIVSAPLVYLIWASREEWPSLRQAAAALAFAALGAANPLLYTLHGGKIFPRLAASLLSTTRSGVDNWDVLPHLGVRVAQLVSAMGGSIGFRVLGQLRFADGLTPVAFAAAWGVIAALAVLRPSRERRLGGLATLVAALLGTTCFTPAALSEQHVMIVWPLPMLVIAAALERAVLALGPVTRRRAALAAALVAAVVVSETAMDARVFSLLQRTGGVEYWSDAVAPLARYLDEHDILEPVAIHEGLTPNVFLESRGRVRPIRGWYDPGGGVDDTGVDPSDVPRLAAFMREPGRRFIVLGEGVDDKGTRGLTRAFKQAAYLTGMRLRLEATFRDRRLRPVYRIYTAEPAATGLARR